MINNKELKKESDYLKTVLYILEKEISSASGKIANMTDDLQDEMKYAWDPTNLLTDTEFVYAIADIHRKSYVKNSITDKIKAYKRMIKSAYFARFDFFDGEDTLPIYMGIATLQNGDYFYVYDWRAPICSLFYDSEIGTASYTTPNGDKISGKIVLKRQYKIEGEKIVQIFDTDMQIIDQILQQMLEQNTSQKMKNIVNTIQKEQNKVIRKNDVDILVVSGPAGSGKTSVAMHKIAYLLYTYKNKINNSNILILSPNDIFSNYISNVLPEIGEDNVYQTTFMDYIKTFLTEYKTSGSINDIYEKIYSNEKNIVEYNSIKFKFSATYVNLIEKYLETLKKELFAFKDIVVDGKVVVTKQYLENLAQELDYSGMSFVDQFKKVQEKVALHISIKTRQPQSKIKRLAMPNIKPKELFNSLYGNRDKFVEMVQEIYNCTATQKNNRLTIKELDDIFAYTSANLVKGNIPFEDVCGYLYFKDRLLGSITQKKIKFVIIDEAQDYSLFQYKILAGLFKNANITLLGDQNQCIMPFSGYNNYQSVVNVLSETRQKPSVEENYLTKTYRSTVEINTFAKSIIADSPLYNQVDRHGDPVTIEKLEQNYQKYLLEQALELKKKYNSVAIITKNQAEADQFKQIISDSKKSSQVKVMNKKDKLYLADRVMIVPSYLSKGLEFDAVLVANANNQIYTQFDKNLFYVVCTRALHKLNIYYTNELTSLIKTNEKKNEEKDK